MYSYGNFSTFILWSPLGNYEKKSCLNKLKFWEASRNQKRSICWKFKLSISLVTQKSAKTPQLWARWSDPFEKKRMQNSDWKTSISTFYWALFNFSGQNFADDIRTLHWKVDGFSHWFHVNFYNYAFYIRSHLLWKKGQKNQNLFISSISYSSFHRMYITWLEPSCMYLHCRFLVPDNTQKILTEIWHHF